MIESAITALYENEIYIGMCKRYGKNNHEDLRSEIIVLLLEKPKKILENIIEKDYLLPYTLRIIRFATMPPREGKGSKGGIFFEKYLKEPVPIDEIDTPDYTFSDKMSKKILSDSLDQNNEYFYHARLVIEKTKYKNIKQLSNVIGVPYMSVRDAISSYRKYLKEWIRK